MTNRRWERRMTSLNIFWFLRAAFALLFAAFLQLSRKVRGDWLAWPAFFAVLLWEGVAQKGYAVCLSHLLEAVVLSFIPILA